MTEWVKLTPDGEDVENTALYYRRIDDEAPHKFAFGDPESAVDAYRWDKGITDTEALAFARQLPEVKALVEAVQNSQNLLSLWRAYLDARDPLNDECGTIEAIKRNRIVLASFQEATDDT